MINQSGWQCFLKLCISVKDKETLNQLMDVLLTHEERASIATRCLIIQSLLDQKDSQRQMSDNLKVSISKITRGSNELKRISSKLKQYLMTHLQRD